MKNIILTAALATIVAGTAMAQDKACCQGEGMAKNSVQVQFGAQYTLGEQDFSNLISPNAAINYMRHVNPYFTFRAGIGAWQSKGGFEYPTSEEYKWNYVALDFDAMLNLSTVFAGKNPDRVFNLYAFAGPLVNFGFGNDEAEEINKSGLYQMDYLWKTATTNLGGRAGLMADIRVAKNWSVNLEVNANGLRDNYNSKDGANIDWYFNALAGVSYNFGHKCCKKPAARPAVVPAASKVENKVVEVHDTVVVTVHDTVTVEKTVVLSAEEKELYLFYDLRSAEISADDDAKLQKLAAWCKQTKTGKILVEGYADRGTGNAQLNAMYAQQRADAAAKALVEKYGISRDQIEVKSYGDKVQPFAENDRNRCVSIKVKEAR